MTNEEAIEYLGRCADGCDPIFDEAVAMAIAALRARAEAQKCADAIQRQGEFGRLFMEYKGCPRGTRGPIGRSALSLEDEALSMPVIEDVDGGRWLPADADALRELAKEHRSLKAQAEAEKSTPAAGWIGVKDGLPQPTKKVLAYVPSSGGAILDMGWMGADGWVLSAWEIRPDAVTHWMPLPEPPEGCEKAPD